ncbi:MAG: FeoA family protein [Candidatus Omnitrophica bacterium]|nr:FeoA family protein [Candidatus Omnitrophota bacterium]
MKKLSDIKTGCVAVIVFIQGGRGAIHRLTELGLLPGEKLTVIHNSGSGPVIISAMGSKLSIGYGLAQKIIVRGE